MSQSEKPTKAFIFSVTAGILIITNAVLLGIVAKWFIGVMPILPGSSGNDPTLLMGLAAAGLIFGGIVLVGALMLRIKPVNKEAWGIIVIVFSMPSVIMGGGFTIGFILGIVGGVKAFKWKPEMYTKTNDIHASLH